VDPEQIHRWYPSIYYGDIDRAIQEYLGGSWWGTSSWRGERDKVRVVERFRSGGRILDVGCAEGKFLWALDGRRWERHGLEFNRDLVSRVQARIPDIGLTAGGLEELGRSLVGFDVMTLWHVFEHLPDPRAALRSARSALAPGGLLVISSPRFDSLQARWFRRDWYPFTDVPRHYFHFSRPAVTRLLRDEGFKPGPFLFFSRSVNFHCWKHSLRSWIVRRTGSKVLYYPCKPGLHLVATLEKLTDSYATLTVVAEVANS
jgi:SAM-dependent methyltransferase